MVNENLDNEVYGDLYAGTNGVFDQMELNMPVNGRMASL